MRRGGNKLPTFDAESKSAKVPNSLYEKGGGGVKNELPTFDAESKSAKISNSLYEKGGGGGGGMNFQLLMVSPNLLNSLYEKGMGRGGK